MLDALCVSAVKALKGFSTILPKVWLFSMYSWAVRISFR